jgi:hypothetical protein
VSKQRNKATGNRFASAYWESRIFRPTYTRDGERFEVSHYCVKIAHGGERRTIKLGSNNLDEAASRAAKLFKALKQKGWEAAIAVANPDAKQINKDLTIGKYLSLVDDYTPLPARTLANYAYALRRISGDIAGAKLARGLNRFDPSGHWKKNADDIPLAKITAVLVEDWRTKFLKENRADQIAQQRAVRSANSYLRNARALFSRRILDAMKTWRQASRSPALLGCSIGWQGRFNPLPITD